MWLIAFGGIALAYFGTQLGHQLIDNLAAGLDQSLMLTTQSLETVSDTLQLAKESIDDVNSVMETAETTADDLARTVNETRPLLDQISFVAAEQVPDSLETIEEAFPSLEQVAGVIDRTLVTLNRFRIDEEIFGLNIQYDLGIDYDPEVPFDQSVRELGEGLEGLPQSLRTMKSYVEVTNGNLQTLSQDIRTLADDLSTLNGRISDLDPLLDDYLVLITGTVDSTRQLRAQLNTETQNAKNGVTIVMIWLAVTQTAPFYLGWELITNRRQTAVPAPAYEADEAS